MTKNPKIRRPSLSTGSSISEPLRQKIKADLLHLHIATLQQLRQLGDVAAIRRASSLLSSLAAESSAASLVQSLIWTDAGLFGAAGAGASSAGLSLGSGLADEARRCGLTAVSTAGLNEGAIADGGTSGMSAGGLIMSSSDALGAGSGGLTSLMAPRRR
jgi:hypothetical protein